MTVEDILTNGRFIIQSQINGAFFGFNDEALFPLVNGQFWIQKSYKYWYHYAFRPRIAIYNYNGTYYLMLEGYSQFIDITRITEVYQGTITNEFRGWSGETIFELDNGQIWKQDEYAYHYSYSFRPHALVYMSRSGYKIKVEGETVRVKRLK
jgi:hypothetical protein